jgi:hypothetical protein
MLLNLPKDRHLKKVWKRCRLCRESQKVHRAAKHCPLCAKKGKRGMMETIM